MNFRESTTPSKNVYAKMITSQWTLWRKLPWLSPDLKRDTKDDKPLHLTQNTTDLRIQIEPNSGIV